MKSNRKTIRPSNDLVDAAAQEIARFQDASGAVDAAAAQVFGLHITDLRGLGRLWAGGPMTAGALADAVGLTRGATTALIDRLEAAGHVRRVRGIEDRRTVAVELTPSATALVDAIWGPIGAAGRDLLADCTDEQLAFLADVLRRGRELQEREARRIRSIRKRA
jgi:DNA-binding MarR family transcriptional regulator